MNLQNSNVSLLAGNSTTGLPGRLSIFTRIYIWSLIFEPLLYFVLATGGQTTGIPLSVSRLLQIISVVAFLYNVLHTNTGTLKKQLKATRVSKYFVYYTMVLLVSTLFGIFIFHSYDITIKNNLFVSEADAPFLKSRYMRPVFDIFLLLYYYFYFIILAKYFINSKKALQYFFKYVLITFYWVLIFGFIDLAFSLVTGGALIKRHFGEGTDVGLRFHSFAGEPRDAFVYLVYASFLMVLYNNFFSKIRYAKIICVLIVAAVILTQSASGILGVIVGGGLAMGYFLGKMNKKAFYFLGVFAIIIVLIIILIPYSPRMQLYIDGFSSLYDNLESGQELPYILLVQSVNFLPFWGMFHQLIGHNYFQFLFGSGFSSAAYFNMNYIGDYSYSNPNAQFTRILFEGGIIGFMLYLFFLTKPALSLIKKVPVKARQNTVFLFFLLTGSTMAHRSLVPFILIGVILAYNHIYKEPPKKIKTT